MAPNDLQELFNRLKANSSDASASPQTSLWTTSEQPTYQQPTVSSPIFSPPSRTPNPIHSSNIISPVAGSPAPDQNRTNNLLNLLKFNNQSTQAGPMANLQNVGGVRSSTLSPGATDGGASSSRPVSAQDLMASFQRKTSAQNVLSSPLASVGTEKSEPVTQTGTSKDFLLNLLTKPKESKPISLAKDEDGEWQDEPAGEMRSVDNLAADLAGVINKSAASRESTPIRHFGTAESGTTAFVAPQPTKPSMFDYVNPFDQLHSSSPLNHPSKTPTQSEPKKIEILKHSRDVSSSANEDAVAAVAKSIELSNQGKSPIGADKEKSTSVSEALKGLGDQVDKEVEVALAQADAQTEKATNAKGEAARTGDNAGDDRTVVKQSTVGEEEIDSSWESAEDEEAAKAEEAHVEVYNFPMKPFVCIRIKEIEDPRPIRQDNFMHIAKLKKEFDQIDRSLVTASQSHIIYAQLATKEDNGGFRIIRQDTGQNKHVFRSSDERIFSVQMCGSRTAGNDVETVLGTGVNGSIFWTSLAKSAPELFADDDVESQGFIMPAVTTPEEQSSGSQVKTRAKMSSRHPEYFAVARGHQIHVIAPETVKDKAYRNAKTKRVNTEKYLAEHGLRIVTGKACKDFCFSEDDTMIVSLDKNGRFRFWDVKDLTSRASDITEGKQDPVELREPVWSLQAAASGSKADEKPSVSSIMFLDKDRPMSKGLALRYMLIGFKQNHILQLWDLGLGKAVQEIQLPHEKDSDGICSVTYHSRHGIIAIGHPTRNSIYFVHLSAPRYGLPHMDQAKYIGHLAAGDNAVPRPDSTAIMSGLREFSFAKVGQLRSLDMLGQPVESTNYSPEDDRSDETLFELYVMHSRGVVGMAIKRKDLGWDDDSKMLNPKDGIDAGVIEVGDLLPPKLPAPSETSSITDSTSSAKQTPKKKHEAAKSASSASGKADVVKKEILPSPRQPANGPQQTPKQSVEAPTLSKSSIAPTPVSSAASYAMAAQRSKPESPEKATPDVEKRAIVPSVHTNATLATAANSDEMESMLNKQFEALYQRIDADKRVQDAAGSAKQDAMLRLISSTLTENVEKSLNRIVSENMTKEIVPSISTTLEKKVSDTLSQQLSSHVAKEVKAALPQAIQQSLKDPQVHNAISNQVAQKIQQQLSQQLQQAMPGLATQAAQKMVADLEARTKQQLQQADARRQQDNAKIEELSTLVQGLSQVVQNMSESQAAFQEQILKMQRPVSQAEASHQPSVREAESTAAVAPDPQKTAEDEEVERITQFLVQSRFDDATVAWLQSPRQGELFDIIFVRVNPRYLEKVNPLLALSVSAAITASFETQVAQRMDWLGAALENINLNDDDSKEIAPKIMDVLSNRLQGAYMRISEASPNDAVLHKISAMHRRVMEVRRLAG